MTADFTPNKKIQLLLLPLGAMARRLHVTTKWLRAEAQAGRIPYLKIDDRFVFPADSVSRLLAERAAKGKRKGVRP